MKKTMQVALIALCVIATTFHANAQKEIRVSEHTNAYKPVKERRTVAGQRRSDEPIQDDALAQIKGVIKNESDFTFHFDRANIDAYSIEVWQVELAKNNNSNGGLVCNGYKLVNRMSNAEYSIMFTKLDNKTYQYAYYNLPLNRKLILVFRRNNNSQGDMYYLPVTGAFTGYQTNISQVCNLLPIPIATAKGQVLTNNITISKPVVVN